MFNLHKNDVISYSHGSTSNDPLGFRIVRPISNLLPSIARRYPTIFSAISQEPGKEPLVIQCYPATLPLVGLGPFVDTYLNVNTACRAFGLAKLLEKTALLCSTPLLAADILFASISKPAFRPNQLVMAVGGYPLPRSLEQILYEVSAHHGIKLMIIQFFGQAEIEMACLFSFFRDHDGCPIYFPRDGVTVSIDNGELLVSINGQRASFDDKLESRGSGIVINNEKRWSSQVLEILNGWQENDWVRRTGYIGWNGISFHFQLREGQKQPNGEESGFFEFSERFQMSWSKKPNWRIHQF